MAEDKNGGLGILLTFMGAILIFLISLVTLGITTDVVYFVYAVEESTLWSDEYRYFNASGTTTNVYHVDDSNLKDAYEGALDARTDNFANLVSTIGNANLVVSLVSLIVVVGLFFMKGGILSKLRGLDN